MGIRPGTSEAWCPTRAAGRSFGRTCGCRLGLPPATDCWFGVYEAEQTDQAEPRAGRLVGEAYLVPGQVAPAEASLIGVVGNRSAGLNQYAEAGGEPYDSRLHEPVWVVTGLQPGTMPDAWVGLSAYSVLVWTQGQPVQLGAERADALRRWVLAGGHLVVVYPRVGGTWLQGVLNNPLADLMPAVRAVREPALDLRPLGPLLATRTDVPLPESVVAHTFEPIEDAQANETIPVLADAQGRPIVVRRQAGIGQVTLVGIDLADEALGRLGLPSADAFWHRVLGRRGDLRPWSARASGGPPPQPPQRTLAHFDQAIDSAIAQTGSPAAGVLLGFVVFITYWIVAGPLSYALLRRFGLVRHAWLAFVAAAVVFTGITWGGAVLLRPASVRGAHLTVLDHVYGQDVQRCWTWTGLIVPWYGQATVRVGEPDAQTVVAAVSPWISPDPLASAGRFPDNRGYRIRSARPDTMRFPVRSTMKELFAQWAGPVRWPMLRPVDEAGGPGRLRSTPRPAGLAPSERTSEATGRLLHDLPGALEDVLIVVNHGMYDVQPGISPNRPVMQASAFRLTDPWLPGQVLDLASYTARDGTQDVSFQSFIDSRTVRRSALMGRFESLPTDARNVGEQLVVASFISQAGPPSTPRTGLDAYIAATRRAMHGLDLGVWMTQPCIMVLGHVQSGPCPTPLALDGQPPRLQGRTFVRWVYPLPPRPPGVQRVGGG
ncbi:MAG: hypothetical protein KatS3mg103_0122 [Phycisphaerales bacterium]|nr:MAG: hypothetical protein KatS3mg103_0122 [Phycisphaerales bacterium]